MQVESERVQKALFEQLRLEYKPQASEVGRLKKLAKMKELGLKAKELQVCLEKRYEQILVRFSVAIEAFKQTVSELLADQ